MRQPFIPLPEFLCLIFPLKKIPMPPPKFLSGRDTSQFSHGADSGIHYAQFSTAAAIPHFDTSTIYW